MAPINRAQRLGANAFIRRHVVPSSSHRQGQVPPDPEIVVDGPRLNKCLDSLEGLSGQ